MEENEKMKDWLAGLMSCTSCHLRDEGNRGPTALSGIEAVEKFYHEIGMPTSIHELLGREITEEELEVMVCAVSRAHGERGATCSLAADDERGALDAGRSYGSVCHAAGEA